MFFIHPTAGHLPEAHRRLLSPLRRRRLHSDWPALTPALTEIRLFVLAECMSASICGTTLNWISWLFSSRRQAHFLLARQTVVPLMPNVRAKRATTAGRQARDAENVHRTCFAGLVACRWRSA